MKSVRVPAAVILTLDINGRGLQLSVRRKLGSGRALSASLPSTKLLVDTLACFPYFSTKLGNVIGLLLTQVPGMMAN
jgi:hypothetical protein